MKRCSVSVFICLYLFLTIHSVPAQTDWQWQYPRPQGNSLYDVEYFSSSMAIAVGAVSTVIKTTNGGSSWTVTPNAAGLSETLRAVCLIDALTATAVGEGGTIIRTADGGETWTAQAGGTSVNLYDVTFASADIGYAVGDSGTVLKTTNGGSDWIQISSGSEAHLLGISFAHPDIGTVVGTGGTILRTTDGGSSWTGQISGTTGTLNAVQFITVNTGYAVGPNLVIKTADGGATWNIVGTSFDWSPTLEDLSFIDINNGLIVGNLDDPEMGVVFFISTEDGGTTWSIRDAPNNVFSLARLDYWEGMAVGRSGMIRRTSDGGRTWSVVGGPPLGYFLKRMQMGGMDFWGIHKGVAVTGGNISLNPSETTVLRTTDGGETWSWSKVGVRLYDVAFADENTVYAVGHGWQYMDEGGVIYRSSDGGASWEEVVSYFCFPGYESCISSFHGIDFGDADHGVAIGSVVVGSNRVIVTIGSGGINRVATGAFSGVSMPDAETAYVVGGNGTILKSTDSGNTWFPQVSGVSVGLSGVHFVDADIGTVVGGNGTILRTWNGGDNWCTQNNGTTDNLSRVSFSSPLVGVVIGRSGTILKTIDGGATWTAERSPIGDLADVHTFNQNNVTIVGGHWSIAAKRDDTVPVFSVVLAARPERTSVQLEWSIDGDNRIQGFFMYRWGGSAAEYTRLNHRLIPKERRAFTDRTVRSGAQYKYTLGVVYDDGSEIRSNVAAVELPARDIELSQNYPNPFNPVTTVRFFLPETQPVKLIVYDVSGRSVRTLVDRIMPFGVHIVEWDTRNRAGREVSSGVYYYQLMTDKRKITRKMVLIR